LEVLFIVSVDLSFGKRLVDEQETNNNTSAVRRNKK
jgi:hypothetical protein